MNKDITDCEKCEKEFKDSLVVELCAMTGMLPTSCDMYYDLPIDKFIELILAKTYNHAFDSIYNQLVRLRDPKGI